MGQQIISTSYLSTIFYPENFKKSVQASLDEARRIKAERGFDTIAFSGTSGAAMAFILARELDVPLLCVRKKGESSHYVNGYEERILEGNLGAEKVLFVDDFISSGTTVNYMLDMIKRNAPNAECIGMLMYAGYGDNYTYRRVDSGGNYVGSWEVFQPRSKNDY